MMLHRALTIDKVVQALAKKKKSHKAGKLCRYAVASAVSCLAANKIQVSSNFLCQKVSRELKKQRNTESVSGHDSPPAGLKSKSTLKKAPPKTPTTLAPYTRRRITIHDLHLGRQYASRGNESAHRCQAKGINGRKQKEGDGKVQDVHIYDHTGVLQKVGRLEAWKHTSAKRVA